MTLSRFLSLLFMALSSCGQPSSGTRDASAQANVPPTEVPAVDNANESFSCGGETDLTTVHRYFADLKRELAKAGPPIRFNKFVAERFTIRSAQGHTLHFDLVDVGAVTPSRISVDDWRRISERGVGGLHNAGYRGCFYDSGKVWFEGEGTGAAVGAFKLTLFAHDMPWMTASKNASMR